MNALSLSAGAVEARARRSARACGYVARKTRWRKDSFDNQGGFMLLDGTNCVVAGVRYELSADDVIDWCRQDTRS